MFTGIIEEKGRVKESGRERLIIEAEKVMDGLKIGDSLAVNGVCLTVAVINSCSLSVEPMPETLRITNLGSFNPGDKVNLERAMRLGDRLGGHFLSGHIDGLARLLERVKEGNAWLLRFGVSSSLSKYMIKRGSVAVDGISLTIADLSKDEFVVSIIPHTFKMTTLGEQGPGYLANIEVDMMAKFVERLMKKSEEMGITEEFLRKHGFGA